MRRRGTVLLAITLLTVFTPSPSLTTAVRAEDASSEPGPEGIILPQSVPDPLEPVNRALWGMNRGIMVGVIKPTARAYRLVLGEPIRTGISHFGRNIIYPGRLINNLLEGRWAGARDETYRFGVNTVLGLGGFFDVAGRFNIPKADADFGQTFGQWGWEPGFFLMLPLVGPSNERDAVGLALDRAANPLTYLSAYPFKLSRSLTYANPYTYTSYAIMYNDLSDRVDSFVRFTRTEQDAYSELAYAWGFVRAGKVADLHVSGAPDEAAFATLQTVFFTVQDPKFPERGRTGCVLIPSTGHRLKFSYWLQPKPAPVVYVIPGLGSHRLAESALALAELIYRNGFSAVSVSNPFNYEFMRQAATTPVPGYPPVDAYDLHAGLTSVDHGLAKLHPGRLQSRAVLGYSMGAFYSLLMAAAPGHGPPLVQFDRCLAINTPVRLLYGVSKLDEFYRAPLAWPAAERTARIENTLLKVAALSDRSLTPRSPLPFSGLEARFLIGLTFRWTLRDVIYTSQARHNMGLLQHRIGTLRRAPVYQEILRYSYTDYFEKFVIPFYREGGLDSDHLLQTFEQAGSLQTYTAALLANPNLRLITNEDDFLLSPSDLEWLRATFPPSQLTVFQHGGHLGNLWRPEVRTAVLKALQDLRSGAAGCGERDAR